MQRRSQLRPANSSFWVQVLAAIYKAVQAFVWQRIQCSFRYRIRRSFGASKCDFGGWICFIFGPSFLFIALVLARSGELPFPTWALFYRNGERMGQGKTQSRILAMLRSAYGQAGISWSLATRKFLSMLFRDTGLILLDADDARLKSCALPLLEKELKEGHSYTAAKKSSDRLSQHHKLRCLRGINLFYLTDTTESDWSTMPRDLRWRTVRVMGRSDAAGLAHPERFSPNALCVRSIKSASCLTWLISVGRKGVTGPAQGCIRSQ